MKRFLEFSIGLLVAGSLLAQSNTTPGTAADYYWGQKATSTGGGMVSPSFWFKLQAVTDRSYCVEAGNFEGSFGDKLVDPSLFVYRQDTTTFITSNDDAVHEPLGFFGARACWVMTLSSQTVFVRLTSSLTVNAPTTLRFVETTLFCPWFFIAGDYNSFSLIRNTSSTLLTGVVVRWRSLSGVLSASTTVNISPNGTVILNARDFVDPGVFSSGSVEIAHTGAPDQLKGSTTTLSGTTGLGFDALFEQRRNW